MFPREHGAYGQLFFPLATLVLGAIATRRERTVGGEVLTAMALSSLALPVGVSSGLSRASALTIASVFAGGFVAATVAVAGVIQHTRHPPAARARILGALTTLGVV